MPVRTLQSSRNGLTDEYIWRIYILLTRAEAAFSQHEKAHCPSGPSSIIWSGMDGVQVHPSEARQPTIDKVVRWSLMPDGSTCLRHKSDTQGSAFPLQRKFRALVAATGSTSLYQLVSAREMGSSI
jgi:hypothetical protein